MRYEYDYAKLKGRIVEKLDTNETYASKLGISSTALYNKLGNRVPFTQNEIMLSMRVDVLDINGNEICRYFFKQKVGNSPTND